MKKIVITVNFSNGTTMVGVNTEAIADMLATKENIEMIMKRISTWHSSKRIHI